VSAERLLSTLIRGGKACRSSGPQARHPKTRVTSTESLVNEAEKTRLYRDTRSHLCGSHSSAVAAM
jgi:hypothetical protein